MTSAVEPEAASSGPGSEWMGIDAAGYAISRAQDPYPAFHALRRAAPVHRTPLGTVRLSRHADCVRVLREVPSGVRRADGSPTGTSTRREGRGPQFMLQQDPPNHTRLRKLGRQGLHAARRRSAGARACAQIVAELLEAALDARASSISSPTSRFRCPRR